jgi:serine/threonine protein kinase
MPLALPEYCRRLTDSGLMSAEDVDSFQAGLPPEKKPKDGQDLARELVKRKRLTEYQAISVYQGRISTLVIGEYIVLDKIGSGGMGRVFKAEHRRMARTVAIKLLSEAAMSSPQAVKRFEQEVRTAARLEHPNIVTAHDAGEYQGLHYLVMQHIDGSDLKTLVREKGRLSVEKAVNYVFQAACGLEHAHLEGVVHRDIKPANLLLDKRGVVKVLDMGLARIEEDLKADDEQPAKGRLTVGNQTLGTADYMSPEQADDTRHADARSDIYSLGCTLYYLLVARPPYPGDTVAQTLIMHHNSAIPSLCKERGDVPEALDAVFQRMVAKSPDDRYQSASDVIVALDSCGVTIDLPQAVKVGGSSSGGFIPNPHEAGRRSGFASESRSDSSQTRTQAEQGSSGGHGLTRGAEDPGNSGSSRNPDRPPPSDISADTDHQGSEGSHTPPAGQTRSGHRDATSGNDETISFEQGRDDAPGKQGAPAKQETRAKQEAAPLDNVHHNKWAWISVGVLLVLAIALALGVYLLQ